LTCVVSVGDDRRFAFRPLATTWEEGCHHDRPAVIDLFPGDIVVMDDHCNDDYLHAVFAARDNNVDQPPNGRISLVLKRAIARAGGRRGHGLSGQGRRSKHRRQP
jgi:alkylated DNA repair dioxygenase AlkB